MLFKNIFGKTQFSHVIERSTDSIDKVQKPVKHIKFASKPKDRYNKTTQKQSNRSVNWVRFTLNGLCELRPAACGPTITALKLLFYFHFYLLFALLYCVELLSVKCFVRINARLTTTRNPECDADHFLFCFHLGSLSHSFWLLLGFHVFCDHR